jgi:hypothetical protein
VACGRERESERTGATANTSLYINKYDVQNNALAGLQIEKCEFARSLAAYLRLECVRTAAFTPLESHIMNIMLLLMRLFARSFSLCAMGLTQ